MGSMPRRARYPSAASVSVSSRGRALAACAVLLVLAQLLLAQLTLVLAVAFIAAGRASRWRLWWLTAPAAAGLIWSLAIGPGTAWAGFTAGAAHVLGYLGRSRLAPLSSAASGQPTGLFAGAGSWLSRQLPVALIAGAAEAALVGWLSEVFRLSRLTGPSGPGLSSGLSSTSGLGRSSGLSSTSGPGGPSWPSALSPPSGLSGLSGRAGGRPRPGLVAAVRTAVGTSLIRSGAVVTRDGCALGVEPGTGAVVQLRWREIAAGALVAGAAERDVTVTSLQVAHAALRRRKPLIVVDVSGDAAIARALAAACAATGTPLRHVAAGSELEPVISERSAALIRVGSAELAARAWAAVGSLAASLRRIGVDGDGLVWVTGGERLPASAAAALIGDGHAAGLAVLIGTTSPSAAAELSGLVAAVLALRVVDPSLAATLAARLTWDDGGHDHNRAAGPGASSAAPADTGRVPSPVCAVQADELLSLPRGEFLLAVDGPRRRLVERGRLVPARLPRPSARPAGAGRERWTRRLRDDPA